MSKSALITTVTQRFLGELKKHFEIVTITLQKLGMAHLGFVDILVIVVVLDDRFTSSG
jgi:hypothetical protein